MSEHPEHPQPPSRASSRASSPPPSLLPSLGSSPRRIAARIQGWWLARKSARSFVNLLFGTLLIGTMVYSAVPRDRLPERLQERRLGLSRAMRKVSLSQTWKMYAPDAARGHSYVEIIAYDAAGDSWITKEESAPLEHGWETAWFWRRDRRSIWQHTVTRKAGGSSRNRVWYLRGVCLREARKGRLAARVESYRVFRRIRSPERVREGAKVLGPVKRVSLQDTSCRVAIIKAMIAEDPEAQAALSAADEANSANSADSVGGGS